MFIYNFSLILIFLTLQQFVNFNFKTIYSFNDLKSNFFFSTALSIILFSIAGVPPFIGFFSKLLILVTLINSNFFLFYIFFFILLFFGLYFYIQNIRFLHSINYTKINYSVDNFLRASPVFYYISYVILFFLLFGFLFFNDLLLYFNWIFN